MIVVFSQWIKTFTIFPNSKATCPIFKKTQKNLCSSVLKLTMPCYCLVMIMYIYIPVPIVL